MVRHKYFEARIADIEAISTYLLFDFPTTKSWVFLSNLPQNGSQCIVIDRRIADENSVVY